MIQRICFFDNIQQCSLKPLSFTRCVADFRIGITTIREKWEDVLKVKSINYTEPKPLENNILFLYGGLLPSDQNLKLIQNLRLGSGLKHSDELIAYFGKVEEFDEMRSLTSYKALQEIDSTPDIILRLHHLIDLNKRWIKLDYDRLDLSSGMDKFPTSVNIIGDLEDKHGKSQLFIAQNAAVEHVTINLKNGPVYIGSNAEIMEGSNLRGPIAVCENSKINMGSRIYGGTTIGPWCKVGGEVNNTLFFGFSNKGHEGFLGDSVIGEWCNLGADTNNSNLKNDYSEVKLWDYNAERFLKTGRQFCGLIMGDFSRSGINTMFNTGTVVGIAANIATSGFPKNFVPSFTLSTTKMTEVSLKSTIEIAERMMARRGRCLSEAEKENLAKIFDETSKYRRKL